TDGPASRRRRLQPGSVLGGARAAVGHRGGAGDRAGAGALVHVQVDLAVEAQRALDHRAGTDDDPRPALDLYRKPVRARPVHGDAAAHVPAHADGAVAADGGDAAGQVDVDQPDRAVGRFHVAADAAAAVDENAAVHGFHVAGDARTLADADL